MRGKGGAAVQGAAVTHITVTARIASAADHATTPLPTGSQESRVFSPLHRYGLVPAQPILL